MGNTLSRLGLLAAFLIVFTFVVSFFRRLGWGELALIAAILALAFAVEIVRYLVKQFAQGYKG